MNKEVSYILCALENSSMDMLDVVDYILEEYYPEYDEEEEEEEAEPVAHDPTAWPFGTVPKK